MKLCRIRRCAQKKNRNYLHFTVLCPFEIFAMKTRPLYNFNTVKHIFMKLCTDINHYQTMCREKEATLHLHFHRELCPFEIFKSCPLYNFNTVKNIVMKLCTNINHHQTMCREHELQIHLHFLRNCAPLKLFAMKIVSAL